MNLENIFDGDNAWSFEPLGAMQIDIKKKKKRKSILRWGERQSSGVHLKERCRTIIIIIKVVMKRRMQGEQKRKEILVFIVLDSWLALIKKLLAFSAQLSESVGDSCTYPSCQILVYFAVFTRPHFLHLYHHLHLPHSPHPNLTILNGPPSIHVFIQTLD